MLPAPAQDPTLFTIRHIDRKAEFCMGRECCKVCFADLQTVAKASWVFSKKWAINLKVRWRPSSVSQPRMQSTVLEDCPSYSITASMLCKTMLTTTTTTAVGLLPFAGNLNLKRSKPFTSGDTSAFRCILCEHTAWSAQREIVRFER